MPAVFENSEIRFDYPDNWTIDEQDTDSSSVTVISPTGAFWSLSVHPAGSDRQVLCQMVLEVLREEYQEIDVEAVRQIVEDQELEGFDVNFYCLDLTSTAMIRSIQTDQSTFVVLCQAEDQDFASLEYVFLAMTTSLLRGKLAKSGE